MQFLFSDSTSDWIQSEVFLKNGLSIFYIQKDFRLYSVGSSQRTTEPIEMTEFIEAVSYPKHIYVGQFLKVC